MKYEKWMENITAEDMPNDDLKYVALHAGLKYALMLIFLLAGLTINIPKHSLKRLKERYILKEYDGSRLTINRLAVECDISQRLIYQIIKKNMKKQDLPPLPEFDS